MKRWLSGLGASIFATVVIGLGCVSSARAADDGYANVFSSVLGAVGVIKPDTSPEIDYRERAPLVLPPQDTLPKPVPATAKRTAAWPQDPDVARRRKEAAEARAPSIAVGDKAEVLSPAELAKGRGQSEASSATDLSGNMNNCGPRGNTRGCLVLSPDELKAEGERYTAANPQTSDTIEAGKEPDRVYLTQPPKGYMKPTKTVKATTEAPHPKLDESNPRAFLMPSKTDDE